LLSYVHHLRLYVTPLLFFYYPLQRLPTPEKLKDQQVVKELMRNIPEANHLWDKREKDITL